MKKIKLLLVFLFVTVLSINVSAQADENAPTYYKITFLDIDEFQLKEMVPVCTDIFQANAENKGEPNVLYFDSELEISEELLKEKLEEKNIDYKFNLKEANDER